jgi:hypothetical protein
VLWWKMRSLIKRVLGTLNHPWVSQTYLSTGVILVLTLTWMLEVCPRVGVMVHVIPRVELIFRCNYIIYKNEVKSNYVNYIIWYGCSYILCLIVLVQWMNCDRKNWWIVAGKIVVVMWTGFFFLGREVKTGKTILRHVSLSSLNCYLQLASYMSFATLVANN